MIWLSQRLHRTESERGFAMVMVLGIGVVLLIVMVTAMTFSVGGLKKAKQDQDSAGALSAAYAGVDEYQSRLTGDSSYGQYGNKKADLTVKTGSKVIPPISPNPAFDVDKAGGWASVQGSGGTAWFRYEVDNSRFQDSGVLRVRSTGKVGEATRSVVANLKGRGFIDFLYITDYEIQDPQFTVDGAGKSTCIDPKYAWEVTGFRTGCTEITFAGGDILNGPVHSNDVMHICDATFTMTVTSAYPTYPHYSKTTGGNGGATCTGQKWGTPPTGGPPSVDSSVTFPKTNSDMRRETQVDQPQDVPRPGCLYTGPTKITFTNDGYMTVRSPWTLYTQAGAKQAPAAGVILAECGTPGTGGLGSVAGQKIKVPDNNLIFVQAVPGGSADPNYWASTPPSPGFTGCTGVDTTVVGNGIGYPSKVGSTFEVAPSTTAYGCRNGDVFIQGALKGRATVAAANYVYVTGELTYADVDRDMLGLVGNHAVWVWNPVDKNNKTLLTDGFRTIQAAILSVDNTFMVQNYNLGSKRGELRVTGAIAQKYRGIVSQNGGYVKRYNYDGRLKTTAPPKFLTPVSTTYGTTLVADTARAFTADGNPVP
ncbi:hypothetical protein [Glaciibacter psychrotolerans]|uniref:Uncharacterized protein n=1 Tax=Glaciibacter psychrotolerans TaxID=670054 RepID=A0A7Z0EH22_9MICO|nr:hypothetical protein [Leifsonia psychrotolerans]NYJ21537.1 hypothetical protein [Leifsonia psychrotolerans]